MAKKKNSTAPPNPHSIPNRDIMQRLNFLYQASTYLTSLAATKGKASSTTEPGSQPVTSSDPRGGGRRVDEGPLATPAYLSRVYVNSMKVIGQKTVVKLDPSVKRTICKGCDSLLIPGVTATVRSKSSSSHQKLVRLSCLNCKTARRIPAPPLLQGDSPPGPESPMQVDGTRAEGRKRKGLKKKVVYKRPFFERPEHILFRGNKMVVKTEDPPPHETAAQASESVMIGVDVTSTSVG